MKKPLTDNQVEKEIRRRNRIFKGKTPAQQRVLIAEDVLIQIENGLINPLKMSYFQNNKLNNKRNILSYNKKEKISLQKCFIKGNIGECNCCALGSLMISTTLFKNKETLNNLFDDFMEVGNLKETNNGFVELFGVDQLTLIERAFEGWGREEKNRIDNFCNLYQTPKERLIAICKNIIKHRGTFKL